MRVLIVHDYGTAAGGAEKVTLDLRDGLRQRGHDARLFASTANDSSLPNLADYACLGASGWSRRLLQVVNPWAVTRLRSVLRAFRPDVVHVRMFLTQLSPGILPLLADVPTLLHVGGYHTICPLGTRILPDETVCTHRAGAACYRQGCVSVPGLARTVTQLRLFRRHQSVFRLIVANSHALARTLGENDVPVTTVIWNGTSVVPPRGPPAGPPLAVFAGRLVPKKGLDTLLEAMAIVVPQVPEARLIIAGDGPDRARIEAMVDARSLRGHVTLSGHLSRAQMDERFAGAWVQALPSRYLEPFPNAAVEAMMRGSAVVATATGGTPELVQEGVTGFLVPPGDHAILAERLTRILSDRKLAESMGEAGRRAALADLTLDRMLDQFEAAYAGMKG